MRCHELAVRDIFSFLPAISGAPPPPRANWTCAAELDVKPGRRRRRRRRNYLQFVPLAGASQKERTDEKKDNYGATPDQTPATTLHSVLSGDCLTRKWPETKLR